jgi:hypothetical protein
VIRVLLACALLVVGMPVGAQQKMNMPGTDMEEVRSKEPYHPGLGELMTAFVQPRHTKLGLAGMAQNWPYAGYELGELRETFEDVGRLVLKHGGLDIPQAIEATVKQPMDALDAAIKAKDKRAFNKAYAELTAGCNACHQSADHAMIVIQAPSVGQTSFPDQNFNAAK